MGKDYKVQRRIRQAKRCIIFILFTLLPVLFGQENLMAIYTVQVASTSSDRLSEAIEISEKLVELGVQDARVEALGEFLVIRAGIFTDRGDAEGLLNKISGPFPGSFIRDAYYIQERVVHPPVEDAVIVSPVVEPTLAEEPSMAAQQVERERPPQKGLILLAFILFALLMFLPFLPGVIEFNKKRDNKPLRIDMEYTRNPRFFDTSFKKILSKALGDKKEPGIYELTLSKKEKGEILEGNAIIANDIKHLIFAKDSFSTGEDVFLYKEVYAKGQVEIGANNNLRALASDSDVLLSDGVVLKRWIGTDGNIKVGNNCNLGIMVSANKKIEIGAKCIFRRIYGNPVMTYPFEERVQYEEVLQEGVSVKEPLNELKPEGIQELGDVAFLFNDKWPSIPPYSKIERDIVAKSSLKIKPYSEIKGSIKVYGDLVIEHDVKIDGNIFCESDIEINDNCSITGDIFSQRNIRINNNVIIGKKGHVKSLIAKRDMVVGQNFIMYGFVLVEHSGQIL